MRLHYCSQPLCTRLTASYRCLDIDKTTWVGGHKLSITFSRFYSGIIGINFSTTPESNGPFLPTQQISGGAATYTAREKASTRVLLPTNQIISRVSGHAACSYSPPISTYTEYFTRLKAQPLRFRCGFSLVFTTALNICGFHMCSLSHVCALLIPSCLAHPSGLPSPNIDSASPPDDTVFSI